MRFLAGNLPAWVSLVVAALIGLGVATTRGGSPSRATVISIVYSPSPPGADSAALASVPINEKEKLGWIVWVWDDQMRSHPGQTFRVDKDVNVTAISVLFASAENMGRQDFSIEFEGYGDPEVDVAPTTEQLAVYSGRLPDDFDRRSPGQWVTFRLSRPLKLQRNGGYAFRFAFEKPKDYELRRAFIRASNAEGAIRSALPGRMTSQVGDHRYAPWGKTEDMMFVLQIDGGVSATTRRH